MNSGVVGNFLDIIINRVGFTITIIALMLSLYLLKFKSKDMSKFQKVGLLIIVVGAICVLGVFVYLIINFGNPPKHIPIPIIKPM